MSFRPFLDMPCYLKRFSIENMVISTKVCCPSQIARHGYAVSMSIKEKLSFCQKKLIFEVNFRMIVHISETTEPAPKPSYSFLEKNFWMLFAFVFLLQTTVNP